MGDFTESRVRGVRCDAGAAKGGGVAPDGVVVPGAQDDRPVGNHRIEPPGVEKAVGCQAAVVRGADDPFLLGMLIGVLLDREEDFLDGTAAATAGPAASRPP